MFFVVVPPSSQTSAPTPQGSGRGGRPPLKVYEVPDRLLMLETSGAGDVGLDTRDEFIATRRLAF
jgi:hypothetical protein